MDNSKGRNMSERNQQIKSIVLKVYVEFFYAKYVISFGNPTPAARVFLFLTYL